MKGKIAKYVTVGTNDLPRAKKFYDELFSELDVKSFGPNDRSCLLYTSPSPRDRQKSRMPSSA